MKRGPRPPTSFSFFLDTAFLRYDASLLLSLPSSQAVPQVPRSLALAKPSSSRFLCTDLLGSIHIRRPSTTLNNPSAQRSSFAIYAIQE